jgi:hypothetical protein
VVKVRLAAEAGPASMQTIAITHFMPRPPGLRLDLSV